MRWVKVPIFIHFELSFIVEQWKSLLLWFQIRRFGLLQESAQEIDGWRFIEGGELLREVCLEQSYEDGIMMMEDIAGIESVGDVVSEHARSHRLMLDQCSDFIQLFDVSEVSLGDVIVVEGEVVGVEMWACFDHPFEVFVALAVAEELDGHLLE